MIFFIELWEIIRRCFELEWLVNENDTCPTCHHKWEKYHDELMEKIP